MSKERLLIAKAAEMQLQFAISLLGKASDNLRALKYGTHPGRDYAQKALYEAEKALACIQEMMERIPE